MSDSLRGPASILDDPRLDMLRDADGKLPLTAQQAEAVLGEGKLLVSAAAGSGKTATLIKRILVAIAEGKSLRDMLICVYNDSAQAELRQRLHAGLINAAISAKDAALRGRLLSAIDDLPFCRISTIHAFCSSLIRENFEKLGISPAFDIADDARVQALFDSALDECFDAYAAEGDAEFATLVDVLSESRNEDGLKKYVKELLDRMVLHEDREAFKASLLCDFEASPLHGKLFDLYSRRLREALETLETMYGEVTSFEALCTKKFLDVYLRQAIEFAEAMLNADSFFELCKIAAETPVIEKPKDSKQLSEAEKEAYYPARYALEDMNAFRVSLAEVYGSWDDYKKYHAQNVRFLTKLCEIAERVEGTLDRLKTEQNTLGYQDLLILASRLLKEHPELGGEFKEIYVDEYQDVDPLQESIFARLIKDECFLVGDVKQSIYGFRLADPSILLGRKRAFEQGEGTALEFNANFRSNRDILAFVNDVFDSVMTYDSADVDYKRDGAFELSVAKPVKFAQDAQAGEGGYSSVKLCLFGGGPRRTAEARQGGLYDITEQLPDSDEDMTSAEKQAAYILEQINSIVGKRLNADYDDGRTLGYGDIAILSRNTVAKSPALKRVLETLRAAGVPLDETNVGSEASEAERELVLMLKAMDNPRQDIPFAGYLLSYFGGYSEQELAVVATNRGDCFYDKFLAASTREDELGEKIRATLASLDEYRLKASFKSVSELMRGIASDYMYDAYMLGKGEGNLAELKNFIASAEGTSLGGFLRDYRAGEQRAVSASADSVRVSTIHKFKGLESPVVFVLDISHTVKEPSKELIFSNDGFVGMKYYDLSARTSCETFSRFALKKLEKAKQLKEEMRLMYVAFTRAKQLMYITETIPKDYAFGQKPFLMGNGLSNPREFLSIARLKRTLRHEPEDDVAFDPPTYSHEPVMNRTPDPELLSEVLAARSAPYKHAQATRLSMKYSVSQLSASDETSENLFAESSESAAKRGTAYHKVMQRVDLEASTEKDISELLDAMVADGTLSEEERAFVRERDILACLASPVMQLAREAEQRGECEREKAFMLLKPAREVGAGDSDDRVLVQGVIDLYLRGQKRVILDFKTGDVSDESTLARYKKQLYLYKTAVEAADNVKVDSVYLYSFKTGDTVLL